jgi:spermidine synthase
MSTQAVQEVIDRRVEDGAVVELIRRGEALDVVLDGRRVMRSDARRGEQQLVELALAPLGQRDDKTVLLAGLGMGFTLRAVLDAPGVTRVDVVEGSHAVLEWASRHFAALNGDALSDPRVKLHGLELGGFLKGVRTGSIAKPGSDDGWLALLLDLDEGPRSLARAGNAAFYGEEGIVQLEAALRPGGVLAMWSAAREPELLQRLHARLKNVAEVVLPVEVEGQAALDYVYRGRRGPNVLEPTRPLN